MASEFDAAYIQEASEGRRTTSTVLSLTTGTGYSVYKSTIIPAIKRAEREVILVTCFWAASVTRDLINEALVYLSQKALSSSKKISVRICFSSASLARNMLLPTPKEGEQYPSSSWRKIGLPRPEELKGLTLRVSRKFFWPFGIIHSKYVVVDRKFAIFPSCNVSWERWYEVAVLCSGPIVDQLLSFHGQFWDNGRSLAAASERAASKNLLLHLLLLVMVVLVTAGTTTPASIQRLRRRAEQMDSDSLLQVSYFDSDDGRGTQHPVLREIEQYRDTVPVKLHAKVTIVDGEMILLGSGNMDAASWKTSQELGILIESRAVVDEFMKLWTYEKFGV
ncbi:hypothetical protein A1O7_07707 [Cladophialophora yegresii CBS 114405]|uniref:PLD phosphodiesterase domain-containing protein n=1 Tax=Cladophialophora yegresii CBS 114405 TaxID=1182544 RepID=W9VXD8_9EURO|nr:uncharacterized protein A1O7_07707 [Cladophialophora yegresii CBS 114405]EXJ57360.1 hypothetical protein A1O7_07707 [Cladophialophora yegresii CBS 114405]